MLTRRGLVGTVLGAAAAARIGAIGAAPVPTRFGGVRMGVCLYDFRDMPRLADPMAYIDAFVAACLQVGVGLVEINANYVEPPTRLPFAGIPRIWDAPLTGAQLEAFRRLTPDEVRSERDRLRKWRISTPLRYFAAVRAKFVDAGLTPFSYVMTFTPDMTDAEIDAIFRQARTLGVRVFSTNQTKVELAPRLAPFAEKYDMDLGFHNHTATGDPNEVASRDSLERLLTVSPRVKVNLDVGHFTAADQDEMAFVRERFDRITHFHMKDRKRHLGPGTPWGDGDSPLKQILLTIRDRGSDTPAFVEYEYRGADSSIVETKRCLDFMKRALA